MRQFTKRPARESARSARRASKPLKNEMPDFTYIVKRLRNFLRPPLQLIPLPKGIVIDENVEIPMREVELY